METMIGYIKWLAGVDFEPKDLLTAQLVFRAVTIYLITLIIVRLGNKRLIGQNSAFDFITSIMVGAVMSRGINGSGPFFGSVLAGIVLIAMHWISAALSAHSHRFGNLIKGSARMLIEDGRLHNDAMRKEHLSRHDLEEATRMKGKLFDPKEFQEAHIERNGSISFITRPKEPRVVEIKVEQGVQTVRIVL